MKNELSFSEVIVGVMRLGQWGVGMTTNELERFIDECIDLGVVDFDHADIYGHYTNETEFGEVLKRRPDLKSKIKITTKTGIKLTSKNRPNHRIKSYDATSQHIRWSVDQSLKELQIDQIELLLIHRPDFLLDPAEVARAIADLQKSGKINFFGVSNFTTSQLDLLNNYIPISNHQMEASVLHLNPFIDGSLDQCIKHGISPTIWSPLGGGLIFKKSTDPKIVKIQEVSSALAQKHEVTMDQILLAWLAKHPSHMVPVLGTSKIDRVRDAIAAQKISLSHEEWYELLEAARGHEIA